MVKRASEFKTLRHENFKGGTGVTELQNIFAPEEIGTQKVKMFAKLVLEPGCSIGLHAHEGEDELLYVLKGVGTHHEDGVEQQMYPGDAAVCGKGHQHFMANRGTETLECLCAIIFE